MLCVTYPTMEKVTDGFTYRVACTQLECKSSKRADILFLDVSDIRAGKRLNLLFFILVAAGKKTVAQRHQMLSGFFAQLNFFFEKRSFFVFFGGSRVAVVVGDKVL